MVINILGNKGGIGKSTISAYIAEYFLSNSNKKLICVDTDPENVTFKLYGKFNAIVLNLKDDKNDINKGGFDELIDIILNNLDAVVVIDNGASSFNALNNYMLENEIIGLFEDEKIENYIVGIVAGGGNTVDSFSGLNTLLNTHETKFIVVNNEFLGTTTYKGVELEHTPVITNNQNKIVGILSIGAESEYIQKDILEFTKHRISFSELPKSEDFSMMSKRRLVVYRDKIFEQLDTIFKG